MTWSTVAELNPGERWTFTPPVEGEYFRFSHIDSPFNPTYWVAQAILEGGKYYLIDKIEITDHSDILLHLVAPPSAIASARVVGIKAAVDTSRWRVSIEASDYLTAGSGASSPPANTKSLVFNSSGDSNGVCYWLGTGEGKSFWSNPHTAGVVRVTVDDIGSGNSAATLVDRAPSHIYNNAAANGFAKIDLGPTRSLAVNYYSIQNGNRGFNTPRNWKLQGSNDDATWTDLRVHANDTTIAGAANSWGSWSVSSANSYRYLRILITGSNSNGNNYLELGEIEFYGTLATTN